jgi:AcrR family transcriptional regulator
MDAVAKEAGRTRGIVYHHFADRAELIAAARAHLYDQLDDLFSSRGPAVADAYGFVAGLVVDSPELILTYIHDLAAGDPREDRLIQSGVNHFREMAAAGRLAPGTDPSHAAIASAAMWFAAVVTVNLGRTPEERRQQAQQFAKTYKTLMESGLIRPAPGKPEA